MRTTWREADDVWVCGPYSDPGGQGDVRAPPTGTQQHGTMATTNIRRDNSQPPRYHPAAPVLYNGAPVVLPVTSLEWVKFDLAYVDHVHHKVPKIPGDKDRTWIGRRRKATVLFYLLGVLIIFFSVAVIVAFVAYLNGRDIENKKEYRPNMEFSIATTWDDRALNHTPVKLTLSRHPSGNDVKIHVEAPFFNDPPNPGGAAGQPFPQLYNYEVVEAFFLNDQDDYLEVELSPHAQHLVLMLRGERNTVKEQLPISYTASQNNNTWKGDAVIPGRYFPRDVTKFNAYAIHGTDPHRVYESLYPVPSGKYPAPDFHKLAYFKTIDFQSILPSNHGDGYHSAEWSSVPAHHHDG